MPATISPNFFFTFLSENAEKSDFSKPEAQKMLGAILREGNGYISFWGQRRITVVSTDTYFHIRGDYSFLDAKKKTEDFFKFKDLNYKEYWTESLRREIVRINDECNTALKRVNCFTRALFNVREYGLIHSYKELFGQKYADAIYKN